MKSIKISVIIPVYQVKEEYFNKCLQSVTQQTLYEIEIILVDDGAEDNLVTLMSDLASSDSRIRVIRQNHRGASAARNTGIAAATGKYVTFVDSDDHISPENLAEAYDFAESGNLEITIWGTYKCFPDRRDEYMPFTETIPFLTDDQKRDLTLKTMVGYVPVYGEKCTRCGSGSCCSKLYLRSFLSDNNIIYPVGIMRSEDVNFNLRAYDTASRIGYLHKFFYYYRQHGSSASYIYRDGGISVFTDALREIKTFLDSTAKPELFYQIYYMRCVFFFLESMDMDYLNPGNKKPLKTRLKMMGEKLGEYPYSEAIERIDRKYLTFARQIPVFLMKHRLTALLALFYSIYKKAN